MHDLIANQSCAALRYSMQLTSLERLVVSKVVVLLNVYEKEGGSEARETSHKKMRERQSRFDCQ
jgi:hypothetical protein